MLDQSQRLQWVDTAKGLSIILVVMMHSAFGVGEETGGTGVLHWIIAFATPFRMPEFFLISGLFLSQVIARDWARFADRRVVHYLYFYALWAVLQILFKTGIGNADPVGAAGLLLWSIVEPYGVLWFIYMLAVFSAATKLLFEARVPHWATLIVTAVLQIAPVTSGSYVVTEFAEYFVYFYGGYALAPHIFTLVRWADEHVAQSLPALCLWAVVNAALVFSPGFAVLPAQVDMGLAALPGLRLALAISGSLALCVTAAMLGRLAIMGWLRWLGSRSIVIYLAFAIPMAVTRTVLVKLGIIEDTGVLSIFVMSMAIVSPLVLYALIQLTGRGRFLFERPDWAHLPGSHGSSKNAAAAVPAE